MDQRLNDQELQNPYLALDRIFANYKLIELRIGLKEIEIKHLEQLLALHDKNSKPYDDTLHLFEQLDKLLQASYLLHDNHHHRIINKP